MRTPRAVAYSMSQVAVDSLKLNRLPEVGGIVVLPGSKSITNRALLLAALAKGTSTLHNLLHSDDTRYMTNALESLGINIRQPTHAPTTTRTVVGAGGPLAAAPSDEYSANSPLQLQLGMAGTAYRPLTAALSLGVGSFDLLGNSRMSERPIGHLVDALRQLGAEITYLKAENFPPVRVTGTGLRGGEVSIRGDISSQFLTSLLLSAPLADTPVTINIEGELVSKPYLDITLALMRSFGASVTHTDYAVFQVEPGEYIAADNYLIEGDASNASYFLAAGAITGNGITVQGIGKNSVQGDVAFTEVLRAMGASVEIAEQTISVTPGKLSAIDMDLNHIPDAAMTAAVLALFAEGTTHLRNLYNLRVKETDRLAALATELTKLGAEVIEGRDFLSITPPTELKHVSIDTYDDHRMAMCFSLIALAGVPVTINDPGCVAKTFPDFFDVFAKVAATSTTNSPEKT